MYCTVECSVIRLWQIHNGDMRKSTEPGHTEGEEEEREEEFQETRREEPGSVDPGGRLPW